MSNTKITTEETRETGYVYLGGETFLACGDVVPRRWAHDLLFPMFGFTIAGVALQGRPVN